MSDERFCGNQDLLMSYLYEDGDAGERRLFEAHVAHCAACAREVQEFRAVRVDLAQWAPPDTFLNFRLVSNEPRPRTWRSWFALPALPAWAQLGAAALLVGVAVGISGLEVRYDQSGVTVRSGWQRPAETASAVPAGSAVVPAPAAAPSTAGAPWRTDLAALREELRSEFRTPPPASRALASAPGQPVNDRELIARVRELIEASESRQQRELALRLAAVVRDVDAQRRADLVRVADGIGLIEGRTGAAVAQQREMLNYLMRVSSQREQR